MKEMKDEGDVRSVPTGCGSQHQARASFRMLRESRPLTQEATEGVYTCLPLPINCSYSYSTGAPDVACCPLQT